MLSQTYLQARACIFSCSFPYPFLMLAAADAVMSRVPGRGTGALYAGRRAGFSSHCKWAPVLPNSCVSVNYLMAESSPPTPARAGLRPQHVAHQQRLAAHQPGGTHCNGAGQERGEGLAGRDCLKPSLALASEGGRLCTLFRACPACRGSMEGRSARQPPLLLPGRAPPWLVRACFIAYSMAYDTSCSLHGGSLRT